MATPAPPTALDLQPAAGTSSSQMLLDNAPPDNALYLRTQGASLSALSLEYSPPEPEPPPSSSTYIRHRSRMVQESVFEDLQDTLIACRWLIGTTTRAVRNPSNSGALEVVTVGADDVYPLAEGHAITLLDYFPETRGETVGPTAPNTFAMDSGESGEPSQLEMGTNTMEQPYKFNFAFFASSDAVAEAVLSDLNDRYLGRLVNGEVIDLYNYLNDPTTPVVHMEIELFRYARNVTEATASDIHLFFAELHITDIVE